MTLHPTTDLSPEKEAVPHEAIRAALNRVLASSAFRTSQRAQVFLRYVVEATLSGNSEALKERIIGIEALGRGASFEPSDDSSVRVAAGDVRKRLTLYYASPEGSSDPLVFDLPVGNYIPHFANRVSGSLTATTDGVEAPGGKLNDSARPGAFRSRKVAAFLTLVLAASLGSVAYFRFHSPSLPPVLQQFWEPVFRSPVPALLQVTPVPVYSLQKPTSRAKPEVADFIELPNQFVDVGDLKAEARIAALLTQAKHPPIVRIGNDVGFDELKKSPAILVGFSYDRWAELNRGLRFYLNPGLNDFYGVTDNGVPTQWKISTYPDSLTLDEDYAIVSRVLDRDTGQVLVQVSGISRYGTEGAADLITNPDLLAQALRDAPPGWQKKNIQIVLHVRVISGSPATPTILATHFW
jgi:hypothetical protein